MSTRIDSATPFTSVRTGGVPILIRGRNFISSDLSSNFNIDAFYSASFEFGGAVSTPSGQGIKLTVDEQINSIAGVTHNTLFGNVFDVSIDIRKANLTFPSFKDVVIIGLRATDAEDEDTYTEITLRYSDRIGYFTRLEHVRFGESFSYEDKAVGAYEISSIRLYRTESGFSSFIKVGQDWLQTGYIGSIPLYISSIKIYSRNFGRMIVGSFNIWVTRIDVRFAVSFNNYPAIVENYTNNEINIITTAGVVGPGKLALGLTDASDYFWPGVVLYTQDEAVKRISLFFDTTITSYQEYASPTREELFLSAGGFVWDQDEFLNENYFNNNLFVPSLWDAKTFNIAASEFQSGPAFGDAIQAIDIVKYKNNGQEKWHAKIKHGSYFINNSRFFLYSEESIVDRLAANFTKDGRSLHNLLFSPKPGIPISVSLLTTDLRSGNVVDKIRFRKRIKFTGKVRNGIELDSSSPENIDPNFYEFTVHYNPNNRVTNWRIPATNATSGIYTFQLPKIPLEEFRIVFSRKDIFKNQKFNAKKYGQGSAILGSFRYGTGPEEPGDWSVDFFSGIVSVWLDRNYTDIGFASFVWDYPAKIEFNNNYLEDYGSQIAEPNVQNIRSFDRIGTSNGQAFQAYTCSEFPVYDLTYERFLDLNNFRLFLYDASSRSFDLEWRRIQSLSYAQPGQKVYELNADTGTVTFGNGIQGAIPPKYFRVYAAYRTSLRIEYEPTSSGDYWLAKTTDLNLSRNNLSSGFLHLTRKQQVPNLILLEFTDSQINALEFSTLRAVVYDLEGEPMPNVPVSFEIGLNAGFAEEEIISTNSDGKASTIFIPNGTIESMGTFVNLFTPGSSPGEVGDFITSSLQNDGLIPNAKIIAEEPILDSPESIYLFKILDAGDPFTPYNNTTRKGGTYQVYYKYDEELQQNVLVRPATVSGRVLTFTESLPQSYDPTGENYEPNLRGFCIVARKVIKAIAKTEFKGTLIQSQAAELIVEYSPIQKGEWTLPVLPAAFNGSEIDRATYITLNH